MRQSRVRFSFLAALSLCVSNPALAGGLTIKPPSVSARASSEYFSALQDSSVVIPVHVWGNVREPGTHFLPQGYSLIEAISSAGGPTEFGDVSAVRLEREGSVTYVDLLSKSSSQELRAKDRIVVERAFKADLPLIFSGVSTLLTVATFVLVLSNK